MAAGTIVIVTFNRPDLLQRTLVYLGRCQGIEQFNVIGYTHGPEHKDTVEILRNMQIGHKSYCVVGRDPGPVWPYSRVSTAIHDALNLAFEVSDFAIHLEEDVLLAPDALKYFMWARDKYVDDPEVFTITGFGDRNFPVHAPYAVRRFNGFCSWSWATWKNEWNTLSNLWDMWEWDRGLREHIRKGRTSVMPVLSRAKTIGYRDGVTNASPHLETWANDEDYAPDQEFYEVIEQRKG